MPLSDPGCACLPSRIVRLKVNRVYTPCVPKLTIRWKLCVRQTSHASIPRPVVTTPLITRALRAEQSRVTKKRLLIGPESAYSSLRIVSLGANLCTELRFHGCPWRGLYVRRFSGNRGPAEGGTFIWTDRPPSELIGGNSVVPIWGSVVARSVCVCLRVVYSGNQSGVGDGESGEKEEGWWLCSRDYWTVAPRRSWRCGARETGWKWLSGVFRALCFYSSGGSKIGRAPNSFRSTRTLVVFLRSTEGTEQIPMP